MSITLQAICFNHAAHDVTTGALNIRRNAAQFAVVPEWVPGNISPDQSVAAYALKPTAGNTLTITAQFSRTDPNLQAAEIRAIDFSNSPINILGQVAARSVTFSPAGTTGVETFSLMNPQLWARGVGSHVVAWRWQYRSGPGNAWTDFAATNHRIYSVLDVPAGPWRQRPFDPGNTQLPWIDVLDWACRWATGAREWEDAAARVTRNIYQLGPAVVEYDCPGGGSQHYINAQGEFDCTRFLERLAGGFGNGPFINCSDCATIVSTFANVLGCALWQSVMGYGFDLNPLLAIGSGVWQTACGWPAFSYHEVGWTDACGEEDVVFDACLQVDSDSDPIAPPHVPLLPVNLLFGAAGAGAYRDRLATPGPNGRPRCLPRPQSRQRRPVR
jgi:hypothetical protein